MLNLKKMVSALLGVTMVANMALSMPAFADETTGCTYAYDGYEVTYDVTNSWGVTEMVSITLSNTGDETIENWMLYFDPNGEITGLFDAQQATTSYGTTYYRNSGYNADVAPNTSVTFSYTVDNCEEIPSDFTLCQTRADKTEGYSVSLRVNQTWGDNNEYFNGEIILENTTDELIEAWELMVDTNFTIIEITNSWAATVTELEPYNYLLKGTYTGTVAANSNVSLGFIGVMDGEPEISDFSLTEIVVDEDAIYNAINYDNVIDGELIDWSTMPDSDDDGLADEYELELGSNPQDTDSDDDGLPDGYEIMTINCDPTDVHSIDSVLTDAEYDNDQDELTNYQEYQLGTNPLLVDSDFDGLLDGDEVNTYGTDPLNKDTDGDGLFDGDEIALDLNPLVIDSDGDGVSDNEEMFSQSMTYNTEDSDVAIDSINVELEGTGYINSNTKIESIMNDNWMCSNITGLIGEPYDISSTSKIATATITFNVNKSSLADTAFDNLIILWYDEGNQRFVEMETIHDAENSTLSTTVNHFSAYLIVDCTRWYSAWSKNNYPTNGNTMHTAITIDCSSSMLNNDPNNYRVIAANGFVDVMSVADLASVILFSDGAYEEQELTDDKEALKNAIDKVTSAGTTNYEAALRYSIDSLNSQADANADDIIIFLSDGWPTEIVDGGGVVIPEDEFDYTLVDEAAAKGIRIYTIGLTENVNENILREMSNRTNGEYYYANTAEELIKYFLTINMGEKYDVITDTDGDGLPDLFETHGMPIANGDVMFSDPTIMDTDGDGLTDGEEVIIHIVDDVEEVKSAYNYMYSYIPDAFISDNGGIYFEAICDPEVMDTDEDGIIDGDEVKLVGKGGIAERYGIQSYDDYEYKVDYHYYNYETGESYLDPGCDDYLADLYPEFKDPTRNNPSNPIYYSINENKITATLRVYFTGEACDELLNGRSRKEIVKEGILENWNNEFIGTVYDFHPGLPVEIEFVFTERETETNTGTGRAFEIKITTSDERSSATRTSFLSDKDCGRITMRCHYKSEDNYKKTAAHEFGHILGLGDAYAEAERFREFVNVEQDEITGKRAIMCSNGNVVANDIEMAFYSAINDKMQRFDPNAYVDISEAIRERQLYQYDVHYSVINEPYNRKINYIWYDGKGYIPNDYVIKTLNVEGVDILYFKENYNGNTTISIFGLSDKSYSGALTIPKKIDNYPITRIVERAFINANIESIEFESTDNLVSIGSYAFNNCKSLKSIDIPDNVSIIREYTFQGCSNLISADLPQNCTIIENNAFQFCSQLQKVTLHEGLKEIGGNTFEGCALKSIEIPVSVLSIYAYAFRACEEMKSITFKAPYLTSRMYAPLMFYMCDNMTDIYVPEKALAEYLEWFEKYANENNVAISAIEQKG